MRADAAISLSVSAEWSRENALMTESPLARPPIASRRGVTGFGGMRGVYFGMRRKWKQFSRGLTTEAGRVQHARADSIVELHFAMRNIQNQRGGPHDEDWFAGAAYVRHIGVECG